MNEKQTIKLEWWKYRHGSNGDDLPYSPWYNSGEATKLPEFSKA